MAAESVPFQGENPEEIKFKLLCREAVRAHPRNAAAVKDAIFTAAKSDIDMLLALFAPFKAQALQLALERAAAAERLTRIVGPRAGVGSGAGQFSGENQNCHARPAPSNVDPIRPKPKPPSAAGMGAIVSVTRRSLLDTITLNGQSIGDLTSREAIGWAETFGIKVRFVRLMTQNLPLDLPIRKFRTADEAAALYAQAEAGKHE